MGPAHTETTQVREKVRNLSIFQPAGIQRASEGSRTGSFQVVMFQVIMVFPVHWGPQSWQEKVSINVWGRKRRRRGRWPGAGQPCLWSLPGFCSRSARQPCPLPAVIKGAVEGKT